MTDSIKYVDEIMKWYNKRDEPMMTDDAFKWNVQQQIRQAQREVLEEFASRIIRFSAEMDCGGHENIYAVGIATIDIELRNILEEKTND